MEDFEKKIFVIGRYSMKKMIKMFAALVVSIVCLSGCLPTNPMYEQADADRITAKGCEMMQAWLAENMSDAELTECAAYTVIPLQGRGEDRGSFPAAGRYRSVRI